MKQINKEDIVKLYILMQNIKHCANLAGFYEGQAKEVNTNEKIWCRKKQNDYEDVKNKYWTNFMKIIYDTYGSEEDFKEDIQSWHIELDETEIGPRFEISDN